MSEEQGISIRLARLFDAYMGVLTGGGSAETFSERVDATLDLMQEPPK